jgi:AbrB family looped-hinge helix DNA binding protein
MSKTVRLTRDGRITIPAEFRKELRIGVGSKLRVSLMNGELRVAPSNDEAKDHAGSAWVRELYHLFAPVRDQIAADGFGEDEINADIESALRAVRADRRLAPDWKSRAE